MVLCLPLLEENDAGAQAILTSLLVTLQPGGHDALRWLATARRTSSSLALPREGGNLERVIERRYRRFSDDERQRIEAALARKVSAIGDMSAGDFVGIPILFGVWLVGSGTLVGWIVGQFVIAERTALWLGIVAGVVLTAVATAGAMLTERRRAFSLRAQLQRDLEDGRMEELHFSVSRTAKLKEFEDEGPGYFLQVADGVLLFLQGQELLDIKPFPAERVTITLRAGSRLREGDIVASGKRLRPVRTLTRIPAKQHRSAIDAMVFRGSIDNIEQDLANLTESEPNRSEELL